MKMKSKLFGLNAKLALGLLLISGAMLTSCYESDKEDIYIPKPVELPEPVYTIAGTVTDLITGKGIASATVTFTPAGDAAAVITATTDVAGAFSVYQGVTNTTYSVVVTPSDVNKYESSAARNLTITLLNNGQAATYMFNEVLNPKEFKQEGLTVITSSKEETPEKDIFDATEDTYKEALDITNDTDEFWDYSIAITVDKGAIVETDEVGLVLTRAAAPDPLRDYVSAYLKGIYTPLSLTDFAREAETFTFTLAPNSSLKSLSVTTKYKTDTYEFTYGGETYKVVVKAAYAYELVPEQYSNEVYHGHGHGNGDNAGGGVIDPIN